MKADELSTNSDNFPLKVNSGTIHSRPAEGAIAEGWAWGGGWRRLTPRSFIEYKHIEHLRFIHQEDNFVIKEYMDHGFSKKKCTV